MYHKENYMLSLYTQFIQYLEQSDKEACVRFVIAALQENRVDIVTLYNEILSPALTQPICTSTQKELCIWEEHVRTSIIRTIIENCFLFVTQERDRKYHSAPRSKVIMVCPTEELHEIVNAIKYIQPAYVAISITNYFNLIAARNAVSRICTQKGPFNFKVILGGLACRYHPETCLEMGADLLLQTFEDIQKLGGQSNAAT
jgi:hypothetical protein